uniref:Peptidase C1A papain C-terminal domain-containing protein n=1 Tax=Globodera rostochiensis TaxID=31243 RepID=A0A914HV99_GLORO
MDSLFLLFPLINALLLLIVVAELPLDSESEMRTIVSQVNEANIGWTATVYPKFARMSKNQRKRLNGLAVMDPQRRANQRKMAPETPLTMALEKIPREFDSSVKWPKCAEVIRSIRDQSHCGDCWAVGAASVYSDRLCIKSDGRIKVSASEIDIASCALGEGEDGCLGVEDLSPGWEFIHKFGVVSGSGFRLRKGCKPYPFPPSAEAVDFFATPVCEKKCFENFTEKTYEQDKLFGTPVVLQSSDNARIVQLIQQEMIARGPVEVGFLIYTDFFSYHSGVYKHTWGSLEGAHAVKLVGWGVEKGEPYWLVANSWGEDWGEHGFFRIRRGTNEAEFEGLVDPYASDPRVD